MSSPNTFSVEEELIFKGPDPKIENQFIRVKFSDGSQFFDSINSARESSIILEESDVVLEGEWEELAGPDSVFTTIEMKIFDEMMLYKSKPITVENISVWEIK